MSGSGLNSTDSVPDMSASKIVQIYAGNMFFYSGLPAGFCTFNPAYVNYLALTNSKLATLPDCLNRYQLIDYLEVSGNNLTVIPSLLTSLPLLRIYGGASNPYMSGPWPVGLGRAQKLSIFNMQGCGLAGPIPGAELANISTLSNLDLSKNQLTGELPDNFFTKGVITQFNVELNRLSGPFPSSVGSRGSSLISILASKNQFTSLPSSLGLLRNLRELDFSDNALTSFPDDSYGRNLTALRYFQIGGNPGLTSPVPTFWANSTYLPQMRDVNISRCGFTGNFPSLDSASLQTVFAFENNLDGTIAPLVKAPSLSVLDIHMNSLQGQIPNSIGVATYLSTFDASYNRLQGTLPPGIAANANAWVTLRLNNNGISGALPNMALFSNLQNFEMQNTFLDLCAIPAQFNTYSPLSSSTCFLYNVGYPGSCFCASNYARCVSNSTDCPAPGYESTPAPLGPAPTPIRPPQVGGISPSSNPSAEPSSASEPEVSVPGIQAEVPTQEPTSPAPASVTSTTYVVAFLGCLVALSLSM
jgi:Leucine-rich repeat (LRR) protein